MNDNIRYTDTSARNNIMCINNIFFIIVTLISTLVSILIGIMLYDELPNQIALQWDFTLNVTRTIEKTRNIIYVIPIVQFVSGSMILMCNIVIRRSKLALVRVNDEDLTKIIKKKLLMSKFILFTLIFVEVIFVVVQYIIFKQELIYLVAIGILLVIQIISTIYFIYKIPKITYPKFEYGWKNKYVYYNKDDASIFVEKYNGIGYTINFANRIAVGIFIATLVVVAMMIIATLSLVS